MCLKLNILRIFLCALLCSCDFGRLDRRCFSMLDPGASSPSLSIGHGSAIHPDIQGQELVGGGAGSRAESHQDQEDIDCFAAARN